MISRATRARFVMTVTAMAFAAACFDSGPPEPVATTITLSPTTVTLDAIGATQQLSATVKDQNGATMTGAAVTWASDAAGVASVSGTGLVTAVADGSGQITATSGSASGSAAVTVAQAAAEVERVSGDDQEGTVGSALAEDLTAQVNDSRGNPVEGVTVNFTPSTGGGTVDPTSGSTDASGQVSTTWTLPTTAGTHTVTAAPATGSGSAEFSATALADAAHTLAEPSGGGQTGQIGATLSSLLIVTVTDQYGNPIEGHTVSFTPGANSGTVNPRSGTTDATGQASTVWTLGTVIGPQTVEASATGLQGSPVTFSATATGAAPASVEVLEGDGQTGLVDNPVNHAPAVLVRDAAGNPFPGAVVSFAVASGGGTVLGVTDTTDAQGVARAGTWTLGASAGGNTLTATVTGDGITGNPLTFTATGAEKAFDIVVRFVFAPTPNQQAAFDDAEAYWENILFGDLPQVQAFAPDSISCGGVPLPDGVDEMVDDLVIHAKLEAIDGPGGVLGQAGPCFLRSPGSLPVMGGMRFDTDDLADMEAAGTLDELVLHEMGHVLGFGVLWPSTLLGLLENPSDTARGGTLGADAHFTGEEGLWAFDQVGGVSYTASAKVPVENDHTSFGTGSLDAHWRESVFNTELMTPALNGGQLNVLSRVSAASMADMGYTVNYAGAADYQLPTAAPAFGAPILIHMENDVWRGPIRVVDPDGRVVRIIERW